MAVGRDLLCPLPLFLLRFAHLPTSSVRLPTGGAGFLSSLALLDAVILFLGKPVECGACVPAA